MTRDRRYRFREDDLAIIKKVAPRVDSSLQALFMLAGAGLFYKGVCLGHQAICQAFGGKIVHAKHLMHGKTSQVKIVSKSNLFKGIKSGFTAARYHSLTADPDSLPSELKVTAQDVDDQEIMAVENSDKSIYGVQFHPELIMTEDGKKIIENFLEE